MAGSIKRVLHVGYEPYKAEDEIWKLNLVPYAMGKKKYPPEVPLRDISMKSGKMLNNIFAIWVPWPNYGI
jgi:hypothetical protein